MAEPYPKSQQLGRPASNAPRRFRKRATRADWFLLRKEKLGPCRVCEGLSGLSVSLHHIVPRSLGGDDVADNLAPLCGDGTTGCHGTVEDRGALALRLLAASLTDAEYSYAVAKLGEGALTRLYGV